LSKITYLLFLGTFLAVGAITYNIYQPTNIQEKKIDVPVVNKIKEAKPLIEEDKKVDNIKSEKILNLQTIRVNPSGDVLIAGKTVPNSELNVISNGKIIAKTLSDNVGEFVIVTENPLSTGDHILAFKITSSEKKIIISNDAIDLSLLITDNLSLDTTDIVMRMYAKAEMLAYQRKYIEALSLYDSLINKYQFHSLVDEALFEKYKIYYELDDFDNCIFALNKILDYNLNDILADDATYYLAKIYDEKINDINLALLNYNIIIEKFQGSIYYDFSRKKIRSIQIKQNDNL